MTQKILHLATLALLPLLASTSPSHAALVGETITVETESFEPVGPVTVTPKGELDFTLTAFVFGDVFPIAEVDVWDTGFEAAILIFLPAEPSASLTFSGLDWGGTGWLEDVSLSHGPLQDEPVPTITNFTPGGTSFTVDLGGVWFGSNSNGPELSVSWTPGHPSDEVPEPSTVFVMGGALVAFGLLRRRRKPTSAR